MLNTRDIRLKLEDKPVVRDFSDVFSKDLLSLLIGREIEFRIDVIPGTQPISCAPYRMTLVEFKQLKT